MEETTCPLMPDWPVVLLANLIAWRTESGIKRAFHWRNTQPKSNCASKVPT